MGETGEADYAPLRRALRLGKTAFALAFFAAAARRPKVMKYAPVILYRVLGATLPEEKICSMLEHIGEGCGVRKTGRLVGVHRDTVMRYSRLAGNHARQLHDELVAVSPRHPGGAVRRKVVVRGQEGKALRSGQPRRRQTGR